MYFRTHLSFSILIALLLFKFELISFSFIFFIVLFFSSGLVDLDSSGSYFGRQIKIISVPLEKIVGHRGILHSFLFGISLVLVFFFISFLNFLIIPFSIGFFSHLFLDCFTKTGIQLFWPLKFKFKGFFRTGGSLEAILLLAFLTINIILIIVILQSIL